MSMATKAAKALGLKLIIWAISFAAVGASLQAEQSLADATWGGMKLLHLILGMMGAGASLFFLPQFTVRWLGATVTCGVVCAIVGTPLLVWGFAAYFKAPFPGPAENVLAMGLGVAGVYIIPAIQYAAAEFKKNPWGFLAWIRGGGNGPPPTPPDAAAADKGGQP